MYTALNNPFLRISVYIDPRDSTPTTKTQIVPVRLSTEIVAYLGKVVKETEAGNTTEAIRLILVERMLADKDRGKIKPFEYIPAPTHRDRKKKSELAEISETNNAPAEGGSAYRGTPTRSADAGISPRSEPAQIVERKEESKAAYWGQMKKPKFPGTREQYEEALKLRTISKDQFDPPDY